MNRRARRLGWARNLVATALVAGTGLSGVLIGCSNGKVHAGAVARPELRSAMPASRSKLAGRWSISFREMERSITGATTTADTIGVSEADEVILLAVREDGRFDWSRMLFGVTTGLHDLREMGDRATSWQWNAGDHEVVAAEYSPTRSRIEVRGASSGGPAMQTLAYASLDATLQGDGSVRLVIVQGDVHSFSVAAAPPSGGQPSEAVVPLSEPERTENSFLLHRYRGTANDHAPIDNVSELAGTWCAPGVEGKAVLVIRSDGTFDWTRTIEGAWGGWYQLERKDDCTRGQFDPRQQTRLIDCRYAPKETRLLMQFENPSADGIQSMTWEWRAKSIAPDVIGVSVQGEVSGGQTLSIRNVQLRRCNATQREESVQSALVEVADGLGKADRTPSED